MPLPGMPKLCSPGTVRACCRHRPTTGRSVIGPLPLTRRRRRLLRSREPAAQAPAVCRSVARELADECGGLCTPALRIRRASVTGRQREVVELVVAGLSNRDIADQLVMSVRTVEGHVYRACQRVGANSREELASIIRSGPGDGGTG